MPTSNSVTSSASKLQPIVRADVCSRITNQIIAGIENGAGDFTMPWHVTDASSNFPRNAASGKQYRGVNVLSLWCAAHEHSYPEALWATYRQWQRLHRQVRRGEKAAIGIFWKPLDATDDDVAQADHDDVEPEDETRTRWVARAFPLFNVAQTADYVPPSQPAASWTPTHSPG